jgi:hypothetical protein
MPLGAVNFWTQGSDATDTFMAGNGNRGLQVRKVTADEMQVGRTNAGAVHLD